MLRIEDVTRWNKWDVAIHYEHPVSVETFNSKLEHWRVESADWVISTSSDGGGRKTTYETHIYEAGKTGTRNNKDFVISVDTPEDDRRQQQKRALALLTAQITMAVHSYAINPHSGNVLKKPEYYP